MNIPSKARPGKRTSYPVESINADDARLLAKGTYLGELVKSDPSQIDPLVEVADALIKKNRYYAAAQCLEKAAYKAHRYKPWSNLEHEIADKWFACVYRGSAPAKGWEIMIRRTNHNSEEGTILKQRARLLMLRHGLLYPQAPSPPPTSFPSLSILPPVTRSVDNPPPATEVISAPAELLKSAPQKPFRVLPFLAGLGTGMGVRYGGNILSQFAMAKLITVPVVATTMATMPVTTAVLSVAAVGVSAAAVGALAGGLASVAKTWVSMTKEERKEKGWRGKAFQKGLRLGALGGVVGAVIGDLLQPTGYLHSFFHTHASPAVHTVSAASAPQHTVSAAHSGATQSGAPASTPSAAALATHAASASETTSAGINKILSAREFNALPLRLRELAGSQDPEKLMIFCKDVSERLFHGPHANPAAAVEFVKRGLAISQEAGLHSTVAKHVTQQLHADLAYAEFNGKGTVQNTPDAIEQAKHAGRAIHNYAGRLFRLIHSGLRPQ